MSVQDKVSLDIDGVGFMPWTQDEAVEHVVSELTRGRGGIVVTPNCDIMRQLRRGALPSSPRSIRVADGMPLVWASRLQRTPLPERVTGADLVWSLSEAAARENRSVYLLGAAPGVADRAASELRAANPALRVAGTYSPAMGFEADPATLQAVVDQVVAAAPDLVFIALGFPRQERVAEVLLAKLPEAWFLGCGGAFDMAAGDIARASGFMQRIGAEWVHRLAKEPRRLGRRYLVEDVPYAIGLLSRAARRRYINRRRGLQVT